MGSATTFQLLPPQVYHWSTLPCKSSTLRPKTFIFPYEAGAQFVSDLWRSGRSWRTVDQAYSRPSTSTEQVLHPAKYIADEGPRPVSLPALLPLLGDGWEELHQGAAS